MTCSRDAAARTNFLALGCVGFVASIASPAAAQTSATAAAPQSSPTRLEGVKVTDSAEQQGYAAEAISSPKATAALIDTPRTVNVITDKVLQDTGSYSLQDALRTVPGITLGAGEGGTASGDIPLIRGVDATGATYVDGARDVGSQTRETFDIDRIEVFKGANSAFGGRGSAGGSINIVSKLPKAGFAASGAATIGTDNFYRVTGDVNAEVAPNTAVRIAGLYHNADVPGRDGVFQHRWGVAPSITYGVGTATSATLAYYHYETDDMPDYGIPLTSRDQLPGGVRVPADVDHSNFYGLTSRDFQKTRADSLTFIFQGDLGGGWALSNTTRYSNSRNNYIVTNPDDSSGNVANGYVWRNTKSRNSLTEGLISNVNLAGVVDTGGITHSLSIGAELSAATSFNRNYSVDTGNYRVPGNQDCATTGLATHNCAPLADPNPDDPWTGTITPSSSPTRARAEDYSLYAFDTATLTPSLLLNGGVRWTHFGIHSQSGNPASLPMTILDNDGDFFTWQGGAIYKPTENTSLYVSYADAKTPPGSDVGEGSNNLSGPGGRGPGNVNQKPQTTENWEAGAKADLFGGGLQLTAAVYRADRGNIIDNDPIAGPTPIANSARLQGFELGATGTIGPVSMVAGYTLVDSEIRDGGTDEGNALPNTPRHNVAVTVNWAVTPRFTLGGGAYGASERFADTANLIRADGYVRFDANAAYQIDDHLDLRLNVQNVGDNQYIVKLRNPHYAVPAAGRQALLTLTARY